MTLVGPGAETAGAGTAGTAGMAGAVGEAVGLGGVAGVSRTAGTGAARSGGEAWGVPCCRLAAARGGKAEGAGLGGATAAGGAFAANSSTSALQAGTSSAAAISRREILLNSLIPTMSQKSLVKTAERSAFGKLTKVHSKRFFSSCLGN